MKAPSKFWPSDSRSHTLALLPRRQRTHRHQHVFFSHDERGGVESGQFKTVAVGDGVGRAGFNAVAAEDAAVVIDVVDLGAAPRYSRQLQ